MSEPTVYFERLSNGTGLPLPSYASDGAAGFDIAAVAPRMGLRLYAGRSQIVSTGFAIEVPPGFEAQVRPRSGLAAKHGITVLNSPGTIDSDYRGELYVILFNSGSADYVVKHGDRIAQIVVAPVSRVHIQEVVALSETERGTGGLGSTGVA